MATFIRPQPLVTPKDNGPSRRYTQSAITWPRTNRINSKANIARLMRAGLQRMFVLWSRIMFTLVH